MFAPSPVPAGSVIPHAVVAVVKNKHIDYSTIISFMDFPRALSLSQLCQKENSRNTVVEDGGNGHCSHKWEWKEKDGPTYFLAFTQLNAVLHVNDTFPIFSVLMLF